MTINQEQDFVIYYIKKNNKKCSIKLERDFAGIDLISNEKKCYLEMVGVYAVC